MENQLIVRKAQIEDAETVLAFIEALAEYEKLSHECVATVESLKASLFSEDSNAFALIGEYQGKPAAFALYFYNYSTFLAKKGIYLEDLFVHPEFRGKGFGQAMFVRLAQIAREENCGRFEWSVLDWNTPAIHFYEAMNAKAVDGWTVYRMTENTIDELANRG